MSDLPDPECGSDFPEEIPEKIPEEVEEKIEAIADGYLEALRKGEFPEIEEIVPSHPELAPEMADLLRNRLQLVDLLHEAAASPAVGDETTSEVPAVRLRCPHCNRLFEFTESPPPQMLTCSNCGSSFRIQDDSRAPGGAAPPNSIGKFKIKELLGRGSFGVVYKALDTELGRTVTLKVPRAGTFGSREEEERFLREARSASMLQHAGIVQVYEITENRGLPCIVEEFIEGRTLERAIQEGGLSFRESAEIVAAMVEALDHAHRQGIVHRDIKPENILLDRAGRPHVTDFGLARRDEGEVTVTLDGQIIGTPAYMSPEQAQGKQELVDRRSDIYSAGVVLYELLTGERPFSGSRTMVIHQVITDEPRPPRRLNDHIPRDLETVCLKAMAKEPSRRYGKAGELAEELRRFLRGEPIRARPVGRAEKLWMWCRRNPVVAGLTGAIAVLLLLGTIGSIWAAFRFEQKAASEQDARVEVTRQLARLSTVTGTKFIDEGDLLSSLPYLASAMALEEGDPRRERMHRTQFASVLARCPRLLQIWFHADKVNFAEFSPDGSLVVTASDDKTARVWDVETGEPQGPPLEHPAGVNHARFSPDGNLVVTGSKDGKGRIWEWSTGRNLIPPLVHKQSILRVSFSPDGSLVITTSRDHCAGIWDAKTGERLHHLHHKGSVTQAAFSPNGQKVITASSDAKAAIWEARSGKKIFTLQHGRGIHHAEFSPDGNLAVTASDDGTAQVWNVSTGEKASPPLKHDLGAVYATFSADSRRVATASWSPTGRVWDAVAGNEITPPLDHKYCQYSVKFSPDGRYVVTAGGDGTARVWDSRSGKQVIQSFQHSHLVMYASFSPDGHRVLTASEDGTARLWDIARNQPYLRPFRHTKKISQIRFSPNGQYLLTASHSKTARIWDVQGSVKALTPWLRHGGIVWHAEFSPDGKSFVTASWDYKVRIWSTKDGKNLLELPLDTRPWCARFSPDGNLLVTSGTNGTVQIWDARTGQPTSFRIQHRSQVRTVAFSADSRLLVSGSHDGIARIWDVATGKPYGPPLKHPAYVFQVSFSRDSGRILTACYDGIARIWDAKSGEIFRELAGHGGLTRCAVFSRDGQRVLTASSDGTALVWDAGTGEKISSRMAHTSSVPFATFSDDGRLVATASADGTGRAWDAETGIPVTPPLPHGGGVVHAEFSPDGRWLATGSDDGVVYLWEIPFDDRPVEDLRLLAELLSSRKIDRHGTLGLLDLKELRQVWESLRSRYPEEFQSSFEEVVAWHHREVFRCRVESDWSAAIWHLDRLIEAIPDSWHLYNSRGYAYRMLSRWDRAVMDGAQAVQHFMKEFAGNFSIRDWAEEE